MSTYQDPRSLDTYFFHLEIQTLNTYFFNVQFFTVDFDVDHKIAHKRKYSLMDNKSRQISYYKKTTFTYVSLDLQNAFISSGKFKRLIGANVPTKSLRLNPGLVEAVLALISDSGC